MIRQAAQTKVVMHTINQTYRPRPGDSTTVVKTAAVYEITPAKVPKANSIKTVLSVAVSAFGPERCGKWFFPGASS